MSWFVAGDPQGKAIAELVKSRSERVTAIVGAALLDASLDYAIKTKLAPDKDAIRELFNPGKPLSGQNKVPLAVLMSLVNRKQARTMRAIYEIRNQFAHNLEMSFNSTADKMRNAINDLNLHDGIKYYPHPFMIGLFAQKIEPIKTNKLRFVVNLKLLLLQLHITTQQHLIRQPGLFSPQPLQNKSQSPTTQASQTPNSNRKRPRLLPRP